MDEHRTALCDIKLTFQSDVNLPPIDLNAELFAIEKKLASVALQLIDFMDFRHGTIAWDDVMVFETDEDVATL